jgi:hypothetical protein
VRRRFVRRQIMSPRPAARPHETVSLPQSWAPGSAYLVTTPGMGVQHLALLSVVFVADRRTATLFAWAASLSTTVLYARGVKSSMFC